MFPATDGEYKEQQQPNFLRRPTLSIISIEPPYYLFDFGRNRGTSSSHIGKTDRYLRI